MSKINGLQGFVDNSFLPLGINLNKSSNNSSLFNQRDKAIKHLALHFAETQSIKPIQPLQSEIPQKITVDFNKDFGGKPLKDITEADTLRVYYTKLAEQSNLSEESKTEFVNEMMNRKPEDLYLTHGGRKHQGTEFEDHKKSGLLTINVKESDTNSIKEYQAKDIETDKINNQKADELINKYLDKNSWSWDEDGNWLDGKRDYPLDEEGLGKELAGENADVINKVLSKLPNPEDAGQVKKAMMENITDEQLANLANTQKGRTVLDNLKSEATNEQSERIDKAKANNAKETNKTENIEDVKLPDGLIKVTPELLRKITPSLSEERAKELGPYLNKAVADAQIKTKTGEAMFLAQVLHEMGTKSDLNEGGGKVKYKGKVYDYFFYMYDKDSPNPKKAKNAIAWLGNTEAGDGERFHGRGYIQLTGRINYKKAGDYLGIDLVNNPELANNPKISLRIAAWFWQGGQAIKGRNAKDFCDIDSIENFTKVTNAINGGTNGLEDRLNKYKLAKEALGVK